MKWRWILIGVSVVLLGGFLGFWGYTSIASYRAQKSVQDTIQETTVEIEKASGYIHINPREKPDSETSPVIYYPGGLVQAEAYVGLLAQVAEEDKRDIYVVTPPFHLSIFAVNRAESIIKEEQLKEPLVGGHSLGGVAACRFVKNNQASRLFLFASYCDKDISQSEVAVVSLMGKRDRIINQHNYQDAKSHLPSDAIIREVEGVNHSDFGQYGRQEGDASSNVSDARVVALIQEAFNQLDTKK